MGWCMRVRISSVLEEIEINAFSYLVAIEFF